MRGEQSWGLVLALPKELEQVLGLWESELGLEKCPAESGVFEKCALCVCVFPFPNVALLESRQGPLFF